LEELSAVTQREKNAEKKLAEVEKGRRQDRMEAEKLRASLCAVSEKETRAAIEVKVLETEIRQSLENDICHSRKKLEAFERKRKM
jgi:hypothetical protein